MHGFDAVIVGAGAAGLFCAGIAGQRGLRVLLVDHAEKVAEKIRISGGGRCNFTNRDAGPAHFLSANPHFCRSALARFTAQDFIALVQRHGIAFHEKHQGQFFCNDSSEQIIAMLLRECEAGGVQRWQPCKVLAVRHGERGFELDTDRGVTLGAPQLVVATGGLSIPKIGASDWGYRVARQFNHRIVETQPALVPLTFDAADWAPFAALAGVSLEVGIHNEAAKKARGQFVEDLLFTHRGLSGPAVLQISSYWRPGQALAIDLTPGATCAELQAARRSRSAAQRAAAHAATPGRYLAGAPGSRPSWRPQVKDRDPIAGRRPEALAGRARRRRATAGRGHGRQRERAS